MDGSRRGAQALTHPANRVLAASQFAFRGADNHSARVLSGPFPRYFVTGTDTNVGKTVASAVLTAGLGARYWKPIQTGVEAGSDRAFVASLLGEAATVPECYALPTPQSPHLAAAAAKTELSLALIEQTFRQLTGPLIVEGAGGIMVPLTNHELMLDLATRLALPVIIVASTRLGTINHSLLTTLALRERGLAITGFVSVGEPAPEVTRSIQRYGQLPHLGHIAWTTHFDAAWCHHAFQHLTLPRETHP